MDNFVFDNYTKIIFGKKTEETVGEEIKKYGSKILLHYGGGSIKKSGLYDKIIFSLNSLSLPSKVAPAALTWPPPPNN